MSDESGLRPLYLVDALAKAVGQEVTYVYDDLIFISHSEVLVQFSEANPQELLLYLHGDLDDTAAESLKAKYAITAKQQGTALNYKGRFSMGAKDGSDEIDLQFFP